MQLKEEAKLSKPKEQQETKEEDFATIRNQNSYKAISHLKQARRLEQIILRIGLIERAGAENTSSIAKYLRLNAEALRNIKKNLCWGTVWQKK